jgi:hypothetical protein
VEAADAVVSVQAEGVDQATKKIKEVDKALGTLPAAAAKADAAAADSSKRWQELAGKVGAAVGAFASVQGLDLSSSSGLVGLAGVAATATAALGPLGLAVTAVGAAVNLLSAEMEDSGPPTDMFLGQLDLVRQKAEETKTGINALSAATGGYFSTLTSAQQVEYLRLVAEEERLQKAASEAVAASTAEIERHIQVQRSYGRAVSAEQLAFLTEEHAARLRAIDDRRAELQLRKEDLDLLAKNNAAVRDYVAVENERAESTAASVKAASNWWDEYLGKLDQVRAREAALFDDLEASRKAKQDADKAEFDQAVELMLWAEQTRADEAADAKKAIADEKRGLRELQGALADFYQWKAEERQRDLDTAMAVNAAALNATVAVAGAFGASEATLNKIKGVSAAADGVLYAAKAYAAAGSLNPWSAVQFGLASVASFAASAAYFQASGGGGGTASAPAAPTGGAPSSVSAPPETRGTGDGGGTTINVSFDRAQRPLTRGDERAIYAGVSRALSGPGGARGLGSRRVAS